MKYYIIKMKFWDLIQKLSTLVCIISVIPIQALTCDRAQFPKLIGGNNGKTQLR